MELKLPGGRRATVEVGLAGKILLRRLGYTNRARLLAREMRDYKALERERLVPCDAAALGTITLERLREWWADAAAGERWAALESQLAGLGYVHPRGGVMPGERRALYQTVLGLRPRRILEIGTHVGSSLIALAVAARELREGDPPVDCQVTTCDIHDVNDADPRWRRHGLPASPRGMMERLGCAEFVTFVVADSKQYLSQPDTPRFDLVFVDGDHGAGLVYRELPRVLAALEPGGHVLLHDYNDDIHALWPYGSVIPGPAVACRRLINEGAGFEVLPFGALPWPCTEHTHVASLAILSAAG